MEQYFDKGYHFFNANLDFRFLDTLVIQVILQHKQMNGDKSYFAERKVVFFIGRVVPTTSRNKLLLDNTNMNLFFHLAGS